jgi:hypothetical protein
LATTAAGEGNWETGPAGGIPEQHVAREADDYFEPEDRSATFPKLAVE